MLDRLLEEAARGAEAGVGEDGVDAAEALERRGGHRLDLVPLGDVAAHGQRPLLATELADQLLQRLQPPRRQHQPVLCRGRPRRRGPNPAARPGDQQDWIGHRSILSASGARQSVDGGWVARVGGHSARSASADPGHHRIHLAIIAVPWIPSASGRSGSWSPSASPCCSRSALVYTSFSASTEAKEPSQLLAAAPGTSYDMTGRVVKGSIQRGDEGLRFRVADRDDASESIPVTYSGTVPDPFRGGREIILTGVVENGVFVGERDTLVTKCPSKFTTG